MAPPTDPVLRARARLGTATRYGTPEEVVEARQNMAAAMLGRAITDALAAGIRPAQRAELAAQLSSGA